MKQKAFQTVTAIYARLAALALGIGLLLRIALLWNPSTTDIGFSLGEWLEIFFVGAINDLAVFTLAFGGLWLFMMSITELKYRRPWGYLILALLVGLCCYVLFFNSIFHQYSGAARRIATFLFCYWALTFALRLFLPQMRPYWSRIWWTILSGIYVGAILMNGISEWIFWSEFGVRYNFIAVDYLVYTHEVVGNIIESYPIGWLVALLVAVTCGVQWLLLRRFDRIEQRLNEGAWRWASVGIYGLMVLLSLGILKLTPRLQTHENTYANELQANGLHRFAEAFRKNELRYDQFFTTYPEEEMQALLTERYHTSDGVVREVINSTDSTTRYNLMVITMESMSGEFMARFGNPKTLTPNLDSLYHQSLAFDRLYATGNRTVRGLEAVSLSLPPCPGQSIIKRTDNTSHTTIGELLMEQGYTSLYFYGGNSYFDNMASFFGGNGYQIIDEKSYTPDEISFRNIWGVCDEDSYRKALRTLDKWDPETPFYAHLMTVSNHRPYTYPAHHHFPQNREGGVMYSDYALGEFLREAVQRDWGKRTIFLVVADHCASSAGKQDIVLKNHHIPALIYAPGIVEPRIEERMVSQIDLMPTLLDVAGINYRSPFYGQSVLDEGYVERAFVATYQDLGYVEGDRMTILSPVRRVRQYLLSPTPDEPHRLEPAPEIDSAHLRRAVAYYQTSAQ